MSRYPPGGALPPLQWGGEPSGGTSSRSSIQHPSSRNDLSPHGLAAPGHHSAHLVADDMVTGGSGMGVSWQQDQQHLMREDVQAVNRAIKQLNAEIEVGVITIM